MGLNETYEAIQKGEVDFVIINSSEFVEKLIVENFLKSHELIMSNIPYIYGPNNDPCSLGKPRTILEGFKTLKKCNWLFYSADNDSGISRIEQDTWKLVGGIPYDIRIVKVRRHTAENLIQTDKDRTYCLIDSGPFNENLGKLSGRLFCTGDKSHKNNYYACVVSETSGRSRNFVSALTYLGWLVSRDGQNIIKNFKKNNENIFFRKFHTERKYPIKTKVVMM